MAIEHADSFDIYGTSLALTLNGVYAQASGSIIADPDGLSLQRVYRASGNSIRYALLTPTDIVGISLRMWAYGLPIGSSSEIRPFEIRDINNNEIGHVAVQTNGAMKVTVNGVLLGSTNSPVVTAQAWWHLECRWEANDANLGKFELRVEGVTVLDLETIDYPGNSIYQVVVRGETSGTGEVPNFAIKDLVIWNDLGTENVDFLGAVRVLNLLPTSDDTLGSWVPTPAGTGYTILDNNPPLDAQYLTAADPAPDAMVFGMADLPDDISSIRGVVTYVRARKTDGGDGKMQVSMVSGADESAGLDRPITAGPVYWRDVHETDPATDAPWTRVAVNAAKIKVDRTL